MDATQPQAGPQPAQQQPGRLIDLAEIRKVLGDTRSPRTFAQWAMREERAGRFPRRIQAQ